jgi:uncharacterized damage-inducible protein DinB
MSEIQDTIDVLKEIHEGDAWHGPALKAILAGVTADQASARPLPNAHSIWELVLHIAAWENVFLKRLEGRTMNEPDEGDFPPVTDTSETSWQRTLTDLDDTHHRLIDTIAGVKDTQATVPGKNYNVAYLMRAIARHHLYHAGQIMLLKKG